VSLKLEGKADSSGSVLFAFDLTFAGVFRVQNVPPQTLQPLVMIECPRLLFPFAREIVATAVRNGGFPPLLLDPVDFVALYQQRVAQKPGTPAAPPTG
jgi:preprotein translocase subunit SecB